MVVLDAKNFQIALEQLELEKGIPRAKLIEGIEAALAAAYKKEYGTKGQIVGAKFDSKTGKTEFWQVKTVVDKSMILSEEELEQLKKTKEESGEKTEMEIVPAEEKKAVFNLERHIWLKEAKKIKKDAKPGDELTFPLEEKQEFGRIAAQTAKQVIAQKIRETEKELVFEEFSKKEGEIVSGAVQRISEGNVFVDLGRVIAVMPRNEQISGEHYRIGERIKAMVLLTEKNIKDINVYLTRTHPKFLIKLFEIEVPEIAGGAVEIKEIARDPGSRTKIAVASKIKGVDPVGSLVGQRGVRVNAVINELGGEKIDIIPWSEDPAQFVANALSPAKIIGVEIEENKKEAKVIAPEDQLSLAIGRGGQNVYLAAKLTGYKIDIRSRTGKLVAEATEGGVKGEGIAAKNEAKSE
ncbi:MAG: transcription termination factor NusA [Candidatus Colwellbacteria bacterium RIFCSPHIGHO2_12_FULL_44_17]|uniref:Transcription termination/antitermination protein NusA n=1 Tax=Candidatus Colwellbacteria bacterium RIFCSPHIGHO2_12_FULL_44_17 TaxID=1797689 RepID=A0A1G1Z6Y2_9BACT|nr:MAG: transcription termination factor NusA [Candidatus Colwellbacteria bacterium RIFCSPHIGHO2_12_FULL_44_17]